MLVCLAICLLLCVYQVAIVCNPYFESMAYGVDKIDQAVRSGQPVIQFQLLN